MVVLLNLLLPFLILIIGSVAYYKMGKTRSQKKKVDIGIIALVSIALLVLVYGTIQPSYLPKGKAKPASKVPYEVYELEVQDRVPKPLTKEQSKQRIDELITVREEVKEVLESVNN